MKHDLGSISNLAAQSNVTEKCVQNADDIKVCIVYELIEPQRLPRLFLVRKKFQSSRYVYRVSLLLHLATLRSRSVCRVFRLFRPSVELATLRSVLLRR